MRFAPLVSMIIGLCALANTAQAQTASKMLPVEMAAKAEPYVKDFAAIDEQIAFILNTTPSNQTKGWEAGAVKGTVTTKPVGNPSAESEGESTQTYCRGYSLVMVAGKSRSKAEANACRNEAGTWKIVE